MKWFAYSLFAVIAACLPATAQVGLPWPGPGTNAGAASYTGPLNLVSGATGWWGLRAGSLAFADGTHVAIRLKRSSDAEICDVLLDTTGTLANTVAGTGAACAHAGTAVATWCNATTCAIQKYYDQSGNANDVVAVAGFEQALTFVPTAAHAINSFTEGYCTAGTISMPQIVSFSTVAKNTTPSATIFHGYVAFDNNPSQFGGEKSGNANKAFLYAGTSVIDVTATSGAFHAHQVIFNGASSRTYIDGTDTNPVSATPGAGSSTAAAICVGAGGTTNNPCEDCYFQEWGIWPNAAATTFASNLSALNSNQHTYWGF